MVSIRRVPHDGHMNGSTNEQTWDAPTVPDDELRTPEPATGPVALQLLAAGVGALAAAVFGLAIGGATALALAGSCSPNDDWCGLGAAVFGASAGLLAAAIAYVVGGVVAIVRRRSPGTRAIPMTIHLAIPPTVVVVMLMLGALAETLS